MIQTNRIHPNGGLRCAYASGTPASADYDVECVVRQVTTVGQNGPAGRIDTAANTMYVARVITLAAATNVDLLKIVAGTQTQITTYIHGSSDGADITVRLSMRGTAIKVYVNGTERISVTDSDISAAGKAGVRGNTGTSVTGYHIDSINGYDYFAIAGSSTAAGTTAGDVAVAHPLAGTSAGAGSDTAAVRVAWALTGSAAGQGSTTGAAGVAWALAAASTATGSTAAGLEATFPLGGNSAGQGSTQGDLTEGLYLIGQAAGQSSTAGAAGAVGVAWTLTGSTTGQGSTAAETTISRPLAGASASQGATSGAVSWTPGLAGTSTGTSSASGNPFPVQFTLAGSSAALSTASARFSMTYGSAGSASYNGGTAATYGGTADWSYGGDDTPVLTYGLGD